MADVFCPHWLGGGIGLIASIHLKAAAGGAGYVEVDSNPNPLRTLLATPMPPFATARSCLASGRGWGWSRMGMWCGSICGRMGDASMIERRCPAVLGTARHCVHTW